LRADFDPAEYREVITECLADAATSGASSTWVLSNHDVVRHASRYGLPAGTDLHAWLMTDGQQPPLDLELGLRRARAASLLMLALPGSAYLYQGEELGLPEVADLPPAVLQDPIWERTRNSSKGRDGCRVPLPWTTTGESHGFGDGGSWLPQPELFGDFSVAAEEGVAGSTLELYRTAIRLRNTLQGDETLEWVETGDPEVVHYVRPGGWHCITNFGGTPYRLPAGTVRLSSAPVEQGLLPAATTVWLTATV
jgi:alpha-glucosidase